MMSSQQEPVPQFVGEGSYGCVLRGLDPCSGYNTSEKYVSKLYRDPSYAEHELKMHRVVDEIIDKGHRFMVKRLGDCKTTVSNAHIQSCKNLVKKKREDHTELHHIMLNDGGEDLLACCKNSSISFEALFLGMEPLFEGVVQLVISGYAHCDIKPQNIVYDLEQRQMKLIDVGLMMRHSDMTFFQIKKASHLYTSHYKYYPPDMWLYYYIVVIAGKLKPKTIQSQYDGRDSENNLFNQSCKRLRDFIKKLPKVAAASGFSRLYDVPRRMTDEYKGMETILSPDNAGRFMYHTRHKWDVYGLGMTLWEVFAIHSDHNGRPFDFPVDYRPKLAKLIHGMVHLSVEKRLYPWEALSLYNEIKRDIIYGMQKQSEIIAAHINKQTPQPWRTRTPTVSPRPVTSAVLAWM